MSDHEVEAWEDLLFGRGESEDSKTCNYCGQSGLHWINVKGRWRLADDFENIHTCEDSSHE